MALDFPNNPADGQVYGAYYYDASISAWRHVGSKSGLAEDIATASPPGIIQAYAGASAPIGWLLCDGSAVSRTSYSLLFSVLSTTYGAGDGSTTFNLPNLTGRTPVGAKAATSLGTATITIAAPGVVTTSAHGLATGQIVYFTTTGALPTGLAAATRYFAIVLTATTFTLATSLANALAGTAITTSGTQSGTHTVYSADFDLGRASGETNHKITVTELASHRHYNGASGSYVTPAGTYYGLATLTYTDYAGGDMPHNNLPPYLTLNYIIKI